ncbi:MAG: methylaspartate ammonia-lyase [Bacillota bacterium]|nr:MAG: methylaspartate ammonia-lyase [Bacillota bacterium]
MKIVDVLFTKSYTGFYFDDQKAIKKDAIQNGFMYVGEPQTDGFKQIRVPGEAISIQLVLENGDVGIGDCAAVQYSGAGGRDPLFLAEDYIPYLEKHIKPLLIGEDVSSFKQLSEKYDHMIVEGKRLHTAMRYGISQALLSATAAATKRTLAEVIRDEYNPTHHILKRVPIFAQSGDDRYNNVDKMILKSVDAMPHALINNVKDKLGYQGEKLIAYVKWMRDRILAYKLTNDYNPILHVDVYGTIGIAFHNDIEKIVDYCKELEDAAKPFMIRLEGPIDTGDREGTMIALRDITKRIDEEKINVEIVADEWCNTYEDIVYFADNKAGHMLQIKTPDLGGLNNIAESILYCKQKGIGAYCGGTCNETNVSAIATTNVAIACNADLCLAKPGMDVDSGFMIVKNEMERVLARANRGK